MLPQPVLRPPPPADRRAASARPWPYNLRSHCCRSYSWYWQPFRSHRPRWRGSSFHPRQRSPQPVRGCSGKPDPRPWAHSCRSYRRCQEPASSRRRWQRRGSLPLPHSWRRSSQTGRSSRHRRSRTNRRNGYSPSSGHCRPSQNSFRFPDSRAASWQRQSDPRQNRRSALRCGPRQPNRTPSPFRTRAVRPERMPCGRLHR